MYLSAEWTGFPGYGGCCFNRERWVNTADRRLIVDELIVPCEFPLCYVGVRTAGDA